MLKLSTGNIHVLPIRNCKSHHIPRSKSRILMKAVNEFLPIISKLLDRSMKVCIW